jgi:uncharacterized cupredoxin-like copper-binding protein
MMNIRRVVGAVIALVLLTLTACGANTNGSTGAAPGTPEVRVELSEFAFGLPVTTFERGKTYRFVVTNTGTTEHELMITPRESHGTSSEHLHEQSLATVHHLAPGATETVEVTFPADVKSEALELSCRVPGHYEAGMKLPISVKG